MSFILDAIRKSDQQRQRSVAPTLLNSQLPAGLPERPAWLWYGLIAALLLGAGILIGWLQQTTPEPAAAPKPDTVRPPEPLARNYMPAPRPPAPPVRQELQAPQAKAAPPAAVVLPPETPVQAVNKITPAVDSGPAPALKPEVRAEAVRDTVGLALKDLPPAIQQEIPKLAILAHSYSSKPGARFVFINDRMLHEGEYPAPGLKLEQITPDGMIFNYKGYRFRRGANADSH